ncbi:rRNA adenine N(6)-methyltransferase family protein [Actinopolymorpha sp. B9G3]|uniref:ribosomal RNA small subunit methyltransferase A n=1 Tax=Actinopolymorpha sp. B9G3 TaxID=3158970 RepID=UPI0032D9810B
MPARPYHTGRSHRVPPSSRTTGAHRHAGSRGGNWHGIHLLRSGSIIDGVVSSAALGPDHLVLDLGAGPGTLTAPLAETGARVLAIEREAGFVARLHKRFGDCPNVRVVEADLRVVPFPRKAFQVVASIPYALSTGLFRRLLDPAQTAIDAADLVVEWGFAKRMTRRIPRDLETAWWGGRFELRIVRKIPTAAFSPAPAVDGAHLEVRRRPGMARRPVAGALHGVLAAAYRDPRRTTREVLATVVPKKRVNGLLSLASLPPTAAAGQIDVAQWADVARRIAADPTLPNPPLPRSLERGPSLNARRRW